MSASRTLLTPWSAARTTSSRTATSWSCPRADAASTPPAGARLVAEVSQPAFGRAKRLSSTFAAAARATNSSSSASVSMKTPLPCETRCTGTSSRSASARRASRQRGPSVLGISTRYCAPSGKRFSDVGNSCRSAGGRPRCPSSLRMVIRSEERSSLRRQLHLERIAAAVGERPEGGVVLLEREGVCDEGLRVEQPVREEPDDPAPGIARGAEDTLHAQVPEHDRVGVNPVRLPRDPLEDDRPAAPRELHRGPTSVDRTGCLEHEIEPGL